MTKIALGLLVICFLCACGPTAIYEESKAFPDSGWAYDMPADFQYRIQDTTKAYDLILNVTHSTDFASQNFYVKLYTTLPAGTVDTQQLSLQLAGEFGAWLGDCSSSECTLSIPLLNSVRYRSSGAYGLRVEQFSRNNPLAGIKALTLKVVQAAD